MFGPNRTCSLKAKIYLGPIWPNKIMGFKQVGIYAGHRPKSVTGHYQMGCKQAGFNKGCN